jgi:hypothetical protein
MQRLGRFQNRREIRPLERYVSPIVRVSRNSHVKVRAPLVFCMIRVCGK